ncbi:MAG TPA: RNA-binding transcriptional accessory protein [Firmicutes bacterium]|nr:RNA-binding transcriptional accessory protein [Bacillota bacterium]
MNREIIEKLASDLNIKVTQVEAVLGLLQEGATIPFIARYRKEATGNLDEVEIKEIDDVYKYQVNLLEKKENTVKLIDEKGLLTEDVRNAILACEKLVEVDEIYKPFKEGKKTKASIAIEMGLEPLAKMLMSFPTRGDIHDLTKKYDMEESVAIENAEYIISEWIANNTYYKNSTKNYIFNTGTIETKKKKNAEDENSVYEMYYDFSDKIKSIKNYRVLALNRGEKEKVLSVKLSYDSDEIYSYLRKKIVKNEDSFAVPYIEDALRDALKRLMFPSIERLIRSDLTEEAEKKAIETFSTNLENMLMTSPIKGTRVLGFDPAFRTGCKLAALDENGNVLAIEVIYPNEPVKDYEGSKKKVLNLINKYDLKLVAIGNGTASRESQEFVASVIKGTDVRYTVVSEAGASVYSASKEAIKEFPDLTVEKRSAISIGRRLQDPLSELIKIDPKSIGVGEYQHDVNQKELSSALDFTTMKVVNEIGVNVNTASANLLGYVSGLTKAVITKIMDYKSKHIIASRDELKKAGLKDKAYEQAIGFLRIPDGINPLDRTRIHPESYEVTFKILEELGLDMKDFGSVSFKEALGNAKAEELASKLSVDKYTVIDILEELKNPGKDTREDVNSPVFRDDVLELKDLKPGMKLTGTVRNVTSFGAFVDIGLHDDGFVHISKMSKNFVKNPNDVVAAGDIVECYVLEVLESKNKVSLSLVKE